MQWLLSEISFVMVTDLLPKKTYKNTTWIGFPIRKKYLPIQSIFPFLFNFLGWMSFLGKINTLGASFDLKYSNNLIHFLVISSPLTLFDINLRLIASITCIISIRLRYTFPWQCKYKSRETGFEEFSSYETIRGMSKFSLKSNI